MRNMASIVNRRHKVRQEFLELRRVSQARLLSSGVDNKYDPEEAEKLAYLNGQLEALSWVLD